MSQGLPAGDAAARVQPVAIALMITGGLSIAMGLIFALLNFMGAGMNAAVGGAEGMPGAMQGTFGGIGDLIIAALGGVVLYGGMKAKDLESYGLAVAAAVLAAFPCTSPFCCLWAMPLGIWALVVLMNADVKAAFKS